MFEGKWPNYIRFHLRHERTCAGKLSKAENGSLAQKNEADQILAKAPCDHDNRKQTGKRTTKESNSSLNRLYITQTDFEVLT